MAALTEHKKKTKGIADEYDVRIFGLRLPREALYDNINRRVDEMFKRGLVREVKRLSRKNARLSRVNSKPAAPPSSSG